MTRTRHLPSVSLTLALLLLLANVAVITLHDADRGGPTTVAVRDLPAPRAPAADDIDEVLREVTESISLVGP